MTYSIGKFSEITELSIDTLRYYEKEKLIIPKRDGNNRRCFTENDITWIEFIKKLKLIGMPIRNMKKYAVLRYQGDETVQERLELLYDQLDILNKQKEEVDRHISFLNHKINIYREMLENAEYKKNTVL